MTEPLPARRASRGARAGDRIGVRLQSDTLVHRRPAGVRLESDTELLLPAAARPTVSIAEETRCPI